MASQPDAGAVTGGQPGDRLPGPGRYRQKSADVEARQLLDDLRNHTGIAAWIEGCGGQVWIPFAEPCLYIETVQGREKAGIGDWIVRFPAGTFRVLTYDEFTAAFEPADGQRAEDQQLPVPNDGPSMHDMVISDLDCWPESDETLAAIRALLEERKRVGLERYASLLQANNGRDARRDLLEELADAIVYARQIQVERGQGPGSGEAFDAYEHIAFALAHAVQIPEASHA